MINEKCAKKFCCEDLSLIENYELAIADNTQTWVCHHILGEKFSRKYLIDNNLYKNRPACELRFLTTADHVSLHMTGKQLSEDTKNAIGAAISVALQGKPRSEAAKNAIAAWHNKRVRQYTKSGKIVKEWESAKIAALEFGISHSNICACCRGLRKSAGGYVWQYA